jgi:ATP/maltotriose-dependent transcriptional regulator MalT
MMGGWRLGLDSDEMNAITEQGRALAQRFDDRASLVRIIAADAGSRGVKGDVQSYCEGSLEAERLVDDSLDLETRIIAKLNRAYATYCAGRMREALPQIEAVGRLAASDLHAGFEGFGYSAAVWSDNVASCALGAIGHVDAANDRVLLAIRRARENDLKENLGWALGSVCFMAWFRRGVTPGQPELRAAALESMQLAEDIASPYSQAYSHFVLAEAHLVSGDLEDAVRSASEALASMRDQQTAREYESGALCVRAEALLGLGDAAAAVASAREAIALAHAQPSITYGIAACCVLARSLLASEGASARSEIESALTQAFAWLDESGSEALRPRALEARAALDERLAQEGSTGRAG